MTLLGSFALSARKMLISKQVLKPKVTVAQVYLTGDVRACVCMLWRVVLVFLEMRDIALAARGNVTTQ